MLILRGRFLYFLEMEEQLIRGSQVIGMTDHWKKIRCLFSLDGNLMTLENAQLVVSCSSFGEEANRLKTLEHPLSLSWITKSTMSSFLFSYQSMPHRDTLANVILFDAYHSCC